MLREGAGLYFTEVLWNMNVMHITHLTRTSIPTPSAQGLGNLGLKRPPIKI
jgi:hypothetical protein